SLRRRPPGGPTGGHGLFLLRHLQEASSQPLRMAQIYPPKHHGHQPQKYTRPLPPKLQKQHVVGRVLTIQKLYAVEREAKENVLDPTGIKTLRLEKSLPVINAMSEWMKRQLGDRMVLPGSAIGRAVRYSADRWDELSNYLYDGNLCIDNNGVENAIRPVALG